MSQTISCSCFYRSLLTFFFALFLSFSTFSQTPPAPAAGGLSPDAQKGESLFKVAGCNTCHAIDEKKVGPALRGVQKRWSSQAQLINFVRNSTKVIASGDPYANKIYNENAKTPMPAHEFLAEADVKAILAYVKEAPATVVDKGTTTGGGGNTINTSGGSGNSGIILTLIIVVLVLVLISLTLVLVFIKRYLKEKEATLIEEEKSLVNQKFDFGAFFKSTGFIATVIFIFVCIALRETYIGLLSVGVEQNYAPKQPIPFSHKLHAGQYKIDCNYCHTGVMKAKQANIPSINICMNCHSNIKEGPKYGKAAIAVLLDHYEKQKPIEWVRIHNLPDLAYFNHAQHVNAGKLECKTCHGAIDTMEVVRQASPLTMGWCINCHRAADSNNVRVKIQDNEYYAKFRAKHKDMTVEQIGGLECSKCHY
ncbi:MAG: c-type cytochrome [Cytophagaceae bacterium]|nr:c-type cytochrome [Cytophagaceae bacterium]